MDDYISRKAVLEAARHNYYPSIDCYCTSVKCATLKDIEAIPAVDVVEVVRCKDCAFWNREDEQPNGCLCEHWSGADALWYTPHDSFCSDGLDRKSVV